MASPTGGTVPMSIGGRTVRERERLIGMSEDERAWRMKFLKDQELHHEPKRVPELEKTLKNPIRRFYRAPLDKLCDVLTPTIGFQKAYGVRFYLGKALLTAAGIYATAYYFKYNANDWTRKGGWRVITSRKACNPGDPDFPKVSDRTKPAHYASRNFDKSPI